MAFFNAFRRRGRRHHRRHRTLRCGGVHHRPLSTAESARGNGHNAHYRRRRSAAHRVDGERPIGFARTRCVFCCGKSALTAGGGGVLQHGAGISIVAIAVGAETFIQRSRQFLNAFLRVQETFLFGIRDETHFRQHRGHARGAEHEKTGLVHSFVLTPLVAVSRLDVPRQFDALFHIAILHKFEDNVALRFVGIKVFVDCSVVGFLRDDAILTFRHSQVFCSRVHTHRVGFCAGRGGHSGRHRVGVDRNEEVGFVAVGNVRAPLEGDEHIGLASVDHLHVRAVGFHHSAESQSNVEVDILLFRDFARSTVVLPPMSRVDDEDKALTTASRRRGSRGVGGETQQNEERHEASCSSQTVNQHNNQFFQSEGRSRSVRREHLYHPG